MVHFLQQIKDKTGASVGLAIMLLFLLLVFACAPAPVKAPEPGRPAAPRAGMAGPEKRAGELELSGDYLGAYRALHDAYRQSRRPDLHRWLLDLIAKMDLPALESLAGTENDSELRCQVLTRLYEKLAAAAAPPARKSPVLEAILADCPLEPLPRQYYEEQLLLARGQQRPTLTIGCLLPLSGDYAAYGRELLQGMELALGVFSPPSPSVPVPLRLLVRDTAGDSDRARQQVRELVQQEGVRIILGPVAGRAARYAAIEAQSLGATMISLSPRAGVAALGSHVFQHFLTVRNQAEQLLRLAGGRLGLRTLALFYPASYYGRQFADAVQRQAVHWGVVVVRREAYDPASDDFGQSIKNLIGRRRYSLYAQRRREYKQWQEKQKLLREAAAAGGEGSGDDVLTLARQAGIAPEELLGGEKNLFLPRPLLDLDFDGVVIPDFYQRLRLLIPQLAFYDLDNCRLLGNRSWNSAKLLADVGPQMEGALFVDAFCSPDADDELAARFQRRYQEIFSRPASVYGAYGYDTVKLLQELLARNFTAGGTFDQAVFETDLLALRKFPLVTGPTSTLPDGELDKQLHFLTVKKGEIRPVDFLCRQYKD